MSSSCDLSDCSSSWCESLEYEAAIEKFLEEEREPVPIRPIPRILEPPHYDETLTKNQRIVKNFVVNARNIYLAYCLLNRKGLEFMVAIHDSKETAIIRAGSYPYCDGDYVASEHFDNPKILYPPEARQLHSKLLKIIVKIEKLAELLKSMRIKLSKLDEENVEDVAFKNWTWEAIEFGFRLLHHAFWKESKIIDALACAIVHTSNFTKLQRCIRTWCEQRGIKDEDLNLLKELLNEVGVKDHNI